MSYTYTFGGTDQISTARFDLTDLDVTEDPEGSEEYPNALLSDAQITAEITRYGYEMGVSALASHLYTRFAREADSVGIAGAINIGLASRLAAWDKLRQPFLAYRARLAATATDTASPVTMPALRRGRIVHDDDYSRR